MGGGEGKKQRDERKGKEGQKLKAGCDKNRGREGNGRYGVVQNMKERKKKQSTETE
jgi:hypothetical protein